MYMLYTLHCFCYITKVVCNIKCIMMLYNISQPSRCAPRRPTALQVLTSGPVLRRPSPPSQSLPRAPAGRPPLSRLSRRRHGGHARGHHQPRSFVSLSNSAMLACFAKHTTEDHYPGETNSLSFGRTDDRTLRDSDEEFKFRLGLPG